MIEVPSTVVRSFSRFLTPQGQLPRHNNNSQNWDILKDYVMFAGFRPGSGTPTDIGKKISLPTAKTVRLHAGVFVLTAEQMRGFLKDLGFQHHDKLNQQQYPVLIFAEGVYPQLVPILAPISQTGQKYALYDYFPGSGRYIYFIWLHPVETTVLEIVPVAYDSPEKALSRSHLRAAGSVIFGQWTLSSYGGTLAFEHHESHSYDTTSGFRFFLTADNMYGTNLETEVSATPDIAVLKVEQLGGKELYARCMRYYVKSHVYAVYTWYETQPDVPPAFDNRNMTGAVFFPLRSFANALVKYDFLDGIRSLPDVSAQLTQSADGTFDVYITIISTHESIGRFVQMEVSYPGGFVSVDTSPLRTTLGSYVQLATFQPTSQTIDYTYKDIDAIQLQYPNEDYRLAKIKHFLHDLFAFPQYISGGQIMTIFPSTPLTYYRVPQLNVYLYESTPLQANYTVSVVLPNGTRQTLFSVTS